MIDLDANPGLLFVAATLLPLVSFVLLLLAGGIRWALRPYAREGGTAAAAYQFFGGDVMGRTPAYVALAAIVLACACSIAGFVMFLMHHHEHEATVAALHKEIASLETQKQKAQDAMFGGNPKAARKVEDRIRKKHHELEDVEAIFEARWSDRIVWASVYPKTAADYDSGTVLRVGYRIDMLAAIMFVMVTFIASFIHLFSMGYMQEELAAQVEDHEIHMPAGHFHRRGRFGRFFMFLSLFCFSMLNLLLADNLFQVFVSWELVGVCSCLLVGFYYERTSASNAANKAFITNRVGDAGFIIGILILFTQVGTLNFQELFHRLRAPERDAHHRLEHTDRFVTANRKAPIDGGYTMAVQPPGQPGTDVLVFPRSSGHLHFEEETDALLHPGPGDYGYLPYWMLVLAGLGIFLGCVGKSAQFPLHVWLPDAMEGPTPVSALIHAATMVAAGVYLVGRAYPLFAPEVLTTIAYVGGVTLFVAATIAIVMSDIKKVLAYSTVSQLGYMMLALGVGGWTAGLFHLVTHAFFKALLFLGSGSVIYGCHHVQDMSRMGGLFPKMKITALTMLAGCLAIAGIPFFSGWYSKDAILVAALSFVHQRPQHALLFILPLLTAGITTFYMFRMWFLTFTGKPRDHHVYEHAHETPWLMTVPLLVLAVCAVGVAWGVPVGEQGYAEASVLEHQIHHGTPGSLAADFGIIVEDLAVKRFGHHEMAGNLALLTVAVGLFFAYLMYYRGWLSAAEGEEQYPAVYRFLQNKWYFDEFYSAALVRPALVVATWCRNFDAYVIDGILHLTARANLGLSRWSGMFDRGVVDGLVNVMADAWYGIGGWLRTWQTGYIRSYVLFLAIAAVAIWVFVVSFFGVAVGAP
jgi:NADH-quinone oxidoreductase subunit L